MLKALAQPLGLLAPDSSPMLRPTAGMRMKVLPDRDHMGVIKSKQRLTGLFGVIADPPILAGTDDWINVILDTGLHTILPDTRVRILRS
jgi:hypothetical protein